MTNQELADYLKECGVCEICQLRYLKARGNEYQDLKDSFERLDVKYEPPNRDDDYPSLVAKKQRVNPCTTCLDLFCKEFQDEIIRQIIQTDVGKFDCKQIVMAISMPMLLQVRQLSMWYALMRKFGEKIDADRAPDVPLKEAAKLILNPIICKKLDKNYDVNGIMINICLDHPEEDVDTSNLLKVNELVFPSKNPRGRKQEITRGYIEKTFLPTRLPAEQFEKFIAIPPPIPTCSLTLENVTLCGPTVFLAGRYRKLTRKLSHTPWVLQGKRVMEDSIQEIIIRSVAPHFCTDMSKIIFSSSGREDVDVRCLGKGRPFVLEIPNSLRVTISKSLACDIELEIEKSMKVSVKNIQMVQRDDLIHIKTGEEKKRKFYRALCVLNEPATVEMLEKLNIPDGFEIQQKTPIRVLHRRPLHTRPRTIYSLKAWVHSVNPKIMVLDIVSQAGTYIKELVHGEFGRTLPSIRSLIGIPVDIIALDVIGIDLDWPKEIDNRD